MIAIVLQYERDTGETVVIRSERAGRRWRMAVEIDGSGPHHYTTGSDPLEWARAYQRDDLPDYLISKNIGEAR